MRMLLVDDHEVVRIGLRTLLSRHSGIEIVGETGDATSAVELAKRLRPDLVLLDVRLTGGSGIDACAQITRDNPATRVIILTSYAADEQLFEAIAAGAAGYVLKQVGSDDLIRAIEAVGRGESLLDPSLIARLFARVRLSVEKDRQDAFVDLTEQEFRIMEILTTGKTNKEIAVIVNLGEKTVRNYVSSILAKLHLTSRAEAAAYGVRHHVGERFER